MATLWSDRLAGLSRKGSIMPLSSPSLRAQHGRMPTHELHPDEVHGTSTTLPGRSGDETASLLLIDPRPPHGLIARANRRWVRTVVHLLGSTLDAQLAQGRPPESNRFLAARAQILVSPTGRRPWRRTGPTSWNVPVSRRPRAARGCHSIARPSTAVKAKSGRC